MPIRQVEPLGKVRTKIVATVGPASNSPAMLRELIEAGVDVFRLNFAHGSQDEHSTTLKVIRTAADDLDRVIAVLQDLAGPKIRLGPIPGDSVACHVDDEFLLVTDRTSDDPHQLTCTYRELVRDLKPGDAMLFADGAVAMVVMQSSGSEAVLQVTLPGELRSYQGVNVPGVALGVKALTDKDLHDLDWTVGNPVDYVGLSFVRQADDILRLRDELKKRGLSARIVAKIEKTEALENVEAIVDAADAVMVARGDLGVEMDVVRVPAAQKHIIAVCQDAGVPVITATQMLNSMEKSSRPTRAEASDVFNAVLDGTDAVMLSGETAIGAYPAEAVATMSRIVTEAERLAFAHPEDRWPDIRSGAERSRSSALVQPVTQCVVEAASLVSRRLGAALLIVATHSGRTALAVSKLRNATPTLALADNAETARALALYWGVTPLHSPAISDVEHALSFALDWALTRNLVTPGDHVVLVRGTLPHTPAHNAMLVQEVR